MTPDDIRQQIEEKVVSLIKEKVESEEMTEEQAQKLSQFVLSVLAPGITFEELFKAIPKLDDAYPELSPITLPFLLQYEERIIKQAQRQVEELVRQGQYDAAVKLADKAIRQDVNIVWQGAGKPQ